VAGHAPLRAAASRLGHGLDFQAPRAAGGFPLFDYCDSRRQVRHDFVRRRPGLFEALHALLAPAGEHQ